jgi:hypothetical protein
MTTYSINVTADVYPQPTEPLDTNEAYLTFVVNRASESYMSQYSTASKDAGITAAREAFNASIPAPVEPVEELEPVEG